MSENMTATAAETQETAEAKTFTQDEVNKLMGELRAKERAKYAGYEDYKAKAEKLDELQEASKSELEKAMERASKAESELETLRAANARREMLDKVSKETGVPSGLLKGDTEDELMASAKQIAEFVKASEPGIPQDKGGAVTKKPTENDGDWLRAAMTSR